MIIEYDMDSVFKELEYMAKEIKRKRKKDELSKENETIDSPEDAPETKEVAPATSKTTEDMHGGDEASKEIEDSPNSAEEGENSDKDNKSEKTEKSGEKNEDSDYFITNEGLNPSQNAPETTPEDLEEMISDIFYYNGPYYETNEEYIKDYMISLIKKISAKHAGIDKQDGSDNYDKKQMLMHMLKRQNHKLLGDKYELKDAKYVQFFIDTSGVSGCGSNKILHELMPEVIKILEIQGYECHIAACSNGFYHRDMVEDEFYGTRKTLEEYGVGRVSKIACPTPKTAAKMANEAEFSIILADFDGLSSICEMASYCQKDKVPYFFSTEDRYSWGDPTAHDWVDPECCTYDLELVYDVSIEGNPKLKRDSGYDGNRYYKNFEDYDNGNGYEYDDDYSY